MPRLSYTQLKQFIRREVSKPEFEMNELALELHMTKRTFEKRKLASQITKILMSLY